MFLVYNKFTLRNHTRSDFKPPTTFAHDPRQKVILICIMHNYFQVVGK